jgi:hypothetical protein
VEKGREAGRVRTLADGGRQAAAADATPTRMPDVRACNAGAESVAAVVATCGHSKCNSKCNAFGPSAPSAPTSLSPKISNLCQTADDAYNAGAL